MTRYIDADALRTNLIKNIGLTNGIDKSFDETPTIDAVPVSELKDTEKERDYWMDKAHSYEQTILRLTISAGEVPVKRGQWKKSGKWGRVYRCNQCGNYLDFDGVNVGRGSANFCPNCGARMDEDGK
jgi:predicted RNA-binding Zn-ribbon protein involved in translation (DUF1610 family)